MKKTLFIICACVLGLFSLNSCSHSELDGKWKVESIEGVELGELFNEATLEINTSKGDFIHSFQNVHSVANVCTDNGPDSGYKEITQIDSQSWSIDNVFDIIFFGYKCISDGESVY